MTDQHDATEKRPKLLNPVKDYPDIAEQFVRSIHKQKPNNLDLAAAELTPLYGFGQDSKHDPLARARAQALFVSAEFMDPLIEFGRLYIHGEWCLPVANWNSTMNLVKKFRNDKAWTSPHCPVTEGGSADEYYARFLILMLWRLKHPTGVNHLVSWLRDAAYEDEDDVCWVLFHALMYRQLQIMDAHKKKTPFRQRVSRYVRKLTGPYLILNRGRDEGELMRILD
ncbi:hypothetical protein HD806DRAFT_48624 [Xylariaceae sp. AK1471]|nr:hypothetical protein HD806DRAFT_48624 [Xylariaceae sp. AK1471]